MNELYIKDGLFYFKTKKDNVEDAQREFLKVCEKAGIEVYFNNAVLRDEQGNVIGRL